MSPRIRQVGTSLPQGIATVGQVGELSNLPTLLPHRFTVEEL